MSDLLSHSREVMLSLKKKEGAYGVAPTPVDATNYVLMHGIMKDNSPKSEDQTSSDMDEQKGSEAPTNFDNYEKRDAFSLNQDRAVPHILAGMLGLEMGEISSTQDAALSAWRHYITNTADGVARPSIGSLHDPANRQEIIHGLKSNSIEVSAAAGEYWKWASELIGSGKRVDSSETFITAIQELLLRMADTKVYIKPNPVAATDIVAEANLSQDTANIDGAAPALANLGATVMDWSLKQNSNAESVPGAGGAGYLQDVCRGTRSWELAMKLRYTDTTYRANYLAKTPMAIEFNCKNPLGPIAATGVYYPGAILRIPKVVLNERPEPSGDRYTIDLKFTVLYDGVNEIIDAAVYTALEDLLT